MPPLLVEEGARIDGEKIAVGALGDGRAVVLAHEDRADRAVGNPHVGLRPGKERDGRGSPGGISACTTRKPIRRLGEFAIHEPRFADRRNRTSDE